MYKSFLIKYAEIAIKGKNRYLFEDALVQNIRYHLERVFETRGKNNPTGNECLLPVNSPGRCA